jgi:hypothetical protein
MIVYLGNTKEFTFVNLLKPINEIRKVARYQLNIHSHVQAIKNWNQK